MLFIRYASVHIAQSLCSYRQDLEQQKIQIMLTLPEVCLDHPQFSALMHSPDWVKKLRLVVEAHFIVEWGDNSAQHILGWLG